MFLSGIKMDGHSLHLVFDWKTRLDLVLAEQNIIFLQKKGIQRTNMLRLSNPKAPSKVKHHLLPSYTVNDVTKRAPCDDNGNVTLMAQGA